MGLAKHTAANVAAQAEPIKINQDSSGLIRTHQDSSAATLLLGCCLGLASVGKDVRLLGVGMYIAYEYDVSCRIGIGGKGAVG
mgnify:CR=1 FL=1